MLLERDGLPRMAGRIFGWLLVCEPPEQSAEDLAAAVHGSKASMSTMTRVLVQAGLIEKVRAPGARRDTFRIRPGQWQQMWQSRMQLLHEGTALTGRGLELLAGRPAAARVRLQELHHQYLLVERYMPELLARLEREVPGASGLRRAAAGRQRVRRHQAR
jgi:hypothetical protein